MGWLIGLRASEFIIKNPRMVRGGESAVVAVAEDSAGSGASAAVCRSGPMPTSGLLEQAAEAKANVKISAINAFSWLCCLCISLMFIAAEKRKMQLQNGYNSFIIR